MIAFIELLLFEKLFEFAVKDVCSPACIIDSHSSMLFPTHEANGKRGIPGAERERRIGECGDGCQVVFSGPGEGFSRAERALADAAKHEMLAELSSPFGGIALTHRQYFLVGSALPECSERSLLSPRVCFVEALLCHV